MGRSCFSGAADSGVLNGWAAEVEVAAGTSFGLGFVAVVVLAVTACAGFVGEVEKDRGLRSKGVRLARRCRHRWQIISTGWTDAGARSDEVRSAKEMGESRSSRPNRGKLAVT